MFKPKGTISAGLVIALLLTAGCGRKAEGPSSVALIQQDLAAGKIDYETALLYQVYAIFKDPQLPKQYRSRTKTRAGDRIFNEIMRNWDSFSAETQEKLKPFRANPLSEESYFYQKSKNPSLLMPAAYAAGPPIAGRTGAATANGKVKVWYRQGEEQRAQWVLEAFDVDTIYERLVSLMGTAPYSDGGNYGDDSKLDIFFDAMSDDGVCSGDWISAGSNRAYANIKINKTLDKENTQSTAVHELFHAIQYNIDAKEKTWWQEQTATWSENFIYEEHDTEQTYLDYYFFIPRMRQSLTKVDDEHEYGSYIWPLYLSQKHGNVIIKTLWQACKPTNVGALDAFKAKIPGGFEEAFKEFASWTHNEKPVKKFRDGTDGLPGYAIKQVQNVKHPVVLPSPHVADLETLAITLDKYFIKPADKRDIRSLEFDFTDIYAAYPQIKIWAVLKIANKQAQLEDWTGTGIRNFCFDLPEEDFESAVFIFVNTDSAKKMPAANSLAYQTQNYGCEAKVALEWRIRSGVDAEWIHQYTGSSQQAMMSGHIHHSEGGDLAVNLLQKTDPDDQEGEKIFVPYGSLSYRQSGGSQGSWAPVVSMGVLTGGGSWRCDVKDTWQGDSKSKKGYATLTLDISGPEEEAEMTEEQWDMLPPGMRQQMQQALSLAENMQGQMEAMGVREPKAGELKYDLRLYFDWLPATDTTSSGDSKIKPDPVELEGIFKETETEIPLKKTIQTEYGSATLQGTLKLKPRN